MADRGPTPLFDRTALRRHRDRTAVDFRRHAFLLREVGHRLLERLIETRRDFPLALDLGCHDGLLAAQLTGPKRPDEGRIGRLLQCDLSAGMISRASRQPAPSFVADEEWLPCGAASLDLVISLFALHWVNDLPGTLTQIRYALKPGGLFIAAFPGGVSLAQLRQVLLMAENETVGGVSARVSPFVEVRDAGMLLLRAGFQLPMADADIIPIDYPDPLTLLHDLRGMGESNALAGRSRRFLRRDTLGSVLARYPRRADGRIEAEVEILYLTGWAPEV